MYHRLVIRITTLIYPRPFPFVLKPVICLGTGMGKESRKRERRRGFTEAHEDTFGDDVYNYLDLW